MKSTEKFTELLEFIQYHCKYNPKRTLHDILPLLNEKLRAIGETQIKEK